MWAAPPDRLIWILADWVGTERMRVNSNQSSQETCTGLSFGDMQSCTGTDENPMHFTGQQWDSEDSLTNFWSRSDSTTQGRWDKKLGDRRDVSLVKVKENVPS